MTRSPVVENVNTLPPVPLPSCTTTIEVTCQVTDPLSGSLLPCEGNLVRDSDCVKDITLTYTINNVGVTDMEVVSVTGQVNDDDSFEMVDQVDPNPVPTGDSVVVTEETTVDLCVDDELIITGFVDARPDNGSSESCQDEVELEIPPATVAPTSTPSNSPSAPPSPSPSRVPSRSPSASPSQVPSPSPSASPSEGPTPSPSAMPSIIPTEAPSNQACIARVAISCVTQDGIPCDLISPPVAVCNDPQSKVSFTYSATDNCSASSNQQDDTGSIICEDLGPLQDSVEITCGGGGVSLTVSPSTVSSGQEFTVTPTSSSDTLPSMITCLVSDNVESVLQRSTISLDGPLHLKEKYGSLQLQCCDTKKCLQTATMTYTVHNEGSHSMTVKNVTRTRTEAESADLVDGLSVNPIPFQGFATVSENIPLDVCESTEINTAVDVAAHPDDGPDCDAFAEYKIVIDPGCALDVDLSCTSADTGESCDEMMDIGSPPCSCPGGCAKELSFAYTGESCPLVTVVTSRDSELECQENDATKPTTVLVTAFANATPLFSGVVEKGQVLQFTDSGNCLAEELVILAIDPMNPSTIYQQVKFKTGCAEDGGIALGKSYGAFDFLGYACQDNTEESCFQDLDLETCAKNEGTVPMTISSSSLDINGEPVDISEIEGEEVIPGGSVCISEVASVSFCGDPSFTVTATVGANDDAIKGCADTETIEFTLISQPTQVPSSMPSHLPTLSPSSSPSEPPSRLPSATPTVPPSRLPSATPTVSPSSLVCIDWEFCAGFAIFLNKNSPLELPFTRVNHVSSSKRKP